MTTEEYNEFIYETIPCALFHVDHDDIDDDTGGSLGEVILVKLIAAHPGCLAFNDLDWYVDKFLTGYLRAVGKEKILNESERQFNPLLDRMFNYSFNEGDHVKFDGFDSEFHIDKPYFRKIRSKDYFGKVGVVLYCIPDVHGFGQGTSYMCRVEFGNGDIIEALAAFFVKADSKKDEN